MSNLNYVPSWLDSAMTLLEKLNKCIEKIETIVNTVVAVTKTADGALSLAKTNEADIAELQGKTATLETDNILNKKNITALQGKTTTLETDNILNKENITALQNEKSGKLYLHQIALDTGSYQLNFFSITEESEKYSDKITNGEAFSTTLIPFNCVLTRINGVAMTKSLTLRLSDLILDDKGNNYGAIVFAAYLDDNNQIVTITDYPEWFSATILGDIVTIL